MSTSTADWLRECIREWRERKGFTYEQAAARLDISPVLWKRWEEGHSVPKGKHLRELAQLGVYIPPPFHERAYYPVWRWRLNGRG